MYQLMISQGPDKIQVGLLLGDELLEYYEYRHSDRKILGDIRLGQVREVVPGLSAVFFNVGEARPAFMPVSQEEIAGYKPGQEVLVQLQKEALGEKGMVVSDHLSFTGRYVVLTPSNPTIGVSGKITDAAERKRLKSVGETFPQPDTPIGYILRTESQGKPEELLRQEAASLYGLYHKVSSRAKYSRIGETVYSAGSPVSSLILSLPAARLEKIVVDDAYLLTQLEEELAFQRPELTGRFTLYRDTNWNLLDFYKISSRLEKAMQKRILLPGGGYLFVEETEALSVIDVNTGKSIRGHQKEAAITAFNLKIIPYIVQQILLRNLSGIIVIDFIDMKEQKHREQVLKALEEEFAAKDRRKADILGFTRLGLVEIARERKGLPLSKLKHMAMHDQ